VLTIQFRFLLASIAVNKANIYSSNPSQDKPTT
jgi:hypothetical protein